VQLLREGFNALSTQVIDPPIFLIKLDL